ncbi:hypothetical protein PAALTS15_01542 [Paenibacillus alvei TS-15]|uniref:Lipoprotein n=1 Tax=Paenibacillus alvei TS-15 TaxID=1117108 RepID=S9SY86_PAEAL|nr:hypothetical protein [Paenibacillus alvei]EPY09068.1 hypothetical protein PAALTS15_01542 [Paenibacillus alvei TS-15]
MGRVCRIGFVVQTVWLVILLLLVQGCTSKSGPVYLEMKGLNQDEQEIVQLINKRMQYLHEGNAEEYMKLFAPNSPITGMPTYQLKAVKLHTPIHIQEQKKAYQVLLLADDMLTNDDFFTSQYVFIKGKESDSKWLIYDID